MCVCVLALSESHFLIGSKENSATQLIIITWQRWQLLINDVVGENERWWGQRRKKGKECRSEVTGRGMGGEGSTITFGLCSNTQ